MFDKLIFPVPPPSYGPGSVRGELVHIPRRLSTIGAARLQTKNTNNNSHHQQDQEVDQAEPQVEKQNAHSVTDQLAPTIADFTCGIFLRSPIADAQHLVIYAHPNAVDIGHMRQEMVAMSRRVPVHVLLAEYQGYGGVLASSRASEDNATCDGMAAYKFAQDVLGFSCKKIICMGRSIGTGVWCSVLCQLQSAEESPLHAVLVAPFTSIRATVKSMVGKSFGDFASDLVGERFNNAENIVKMKCDVTILHGTKDDIVPYAHGVALGKLSPEVGTCKLVSLANVGHNDIPMQPSFDIVQGIVSADQRKVPSPAVARSFEQRLRPYLVNSSIHHSLQTGRSRPPPLLLPQQGATSASSSSSATGAAAASAVSSAKSSNHFGESLAHTICYNITSFLSLVRASWEVYLLAREEASLHASGSEQLLEHLSVFTSSFSHLRGSQQLAEQWRLSDYVELCAALWGQPLAAGNLVHSPAATGSVTAEAEKNNDDGEDTPQNLESPPTPSRRCLVFGTAVSNPSQIFDGLQESSHYDEIWRRDLGPALHKVYEDIRRVVQQAAADGEASAAAAASEPKSRKEIMASSWKTQQGAEAAAKGAESETSALVVPTAAARPPVLPENKVVEVAKKQLQKGAVYHTAALVAGHTQLREKFVPTLFWQLSPTLLKICCDNIEKQVRPALESLKRVHDQAEAKKPLSVSEKGAGFLQIDAERFIISCFHNNDYAAPALLQQSLLAESTAMMSTTTSTTTSDEAAAHQWRSTLLELLSSPYVDRVLVPLPLTVETSNALMAIVQHTRTAPPIVRIAPANVATEGVGNGSGGKKTPASDCLIA